MGNAFSSASARERLTEYVISESETLSNTSDPHDMEAEETEQFHDTIDENVSDEKARAKAKEEEMIEFRRQLDIKREQRRQILARHRAEKGELEKTLEKERKSKLELFESNRQLRELLARNNIDIPDDHQSATDNSELSITIRHMKEEFENLKSNNNKLRKELAESNSSLQTAFADIAELNAQNTESMKHINALKEVVAVSKTMINLREQQLNELKNKLSEIERSLADRETSMLSTDLRQEYERQLQNIRTLRGLYEERARLSEVTRLGLVRELEEQKSLYQAENNKCKNLTAKVEELEATVDNLHEKIENKNNQISTYQSETNGLQAEMGVVNKLFSQVLLGYKTKQDLDKLVHRLEENHGLLTHMAEKENGSEASTALPKLLLEIVSQVDENEKPDYDLVAEETEDEENKFSKEKDATNLSHTTPEEIVENLPKVWRVLIELLSHQNVAETNSSEKVTTCYKSVETKSGPVLVPSVSQTYIRLKDLIIEKLGLIKEVNRMKQLNVHLETRLEEQERRLCLVTSELSKTWHVVGRLRRHHHQLHTHEKILKYELQQKRKMLNELKEELEYCREKWIQAREKNTQSEKDWRKLRAEFSSRHMKDGSPSCNNSAESGYSDERPSDDSSESTDESEYIAEPFLRCKKINKKSFDTVLDSSTDMNLVAEREDPSSDMLDVADLPLDTQDETHTEDLLKSDTICDETEDEVGEILNETRVSGTSISKNIDDSNNCNIKNSSSIENNTAATEENPSTSTTVDDSTSNIALIGPKEILMNIKIQNERLAKKDEKLGRLEKSSAALLMKTQNTTKLSEQVNSTLDNLISRPTHVEPIVKSNVRTIVEPEIANECNISQIPETDITEMTISEHTEDLPNTSNVFKPSEDNLQQSDSVNNIDRKHIEKDNEDIDNVSSSSHQYSLNDLRQNTNIDENEFQNTIENTIASTEISEPSVSNDHEARFAARDLRLRRLEEQTKSLVNKVNKTTTKGVKIHYKLEELHNIYGSESSRAGTPSDDTEDRSQKEDDSQEE